MDRISKIEHLRSARNTLLPYGRWTRLCDGADTLHDREYDPLWQRMDGGPAGPVTPAGDCLMRHVEYFYTDGNTIPEQVAAGLAVLKAWGLPVPEFFRT